MNYRLIATTPARSTSGAAYNRIAWMSEFDELDSPVEEAEHYVRQCMELNHPGLAFTLSFEDIPTTLH